jgi:recombinational DNA repair protein (RecF pathway)
MQGYILDIKAVRDEDLIVTILSQNKIYTLYRFYGKRHSVINIGYKIDFESESNIKSTIARLKDTIQLGFPWIFDSNKLYHWQRFLKLLATHFRDIDDVGDFYFDMLEDAVLKIEKQNIYRVLIEKYVKLLEYEGRLHNEYICLLCDKSIEDNISLVRGFVPVCPKCSYSKSFKLDKIDRLFLGFTTIELSDEECEYIWNIVLQGI